MTTTKSYDYLNRLTQIASAPTGSGAVPVNFNYTYNSANQRTKDTLSDGSYWIYQYDSLGQVTDGVKHFADGTLVPGQQFGYLFDDIGNRKQTTAGGDAVGASLRLASYSVNNLNQITNRNYPGTNDVTGEQDYGWSSTNARVFWRHNVGTSDYYTNAIGDSHSDDGCHGITGLPDQDLYAFLGVDIDYGYPDRSHWIYHYFANNVHHHLVSDNGTVVDFKVAARTRMKLTQRTRHMSPLARCLLIQQREMRC